jgi:hypothetical protein
MPGSSLVDEADSNFSTPRAYDDIYTGLAVSDEAAKSVVADDHEIGAPTHTDSLGQQTHWHTIATFELVGALSTHPKEGLKHEQLLQRQVRYGPNRLAEVPPVPLWR